MLTPYALSTDGRATPLGIDEKTPLLSWRLRSDTNGDAQTAYRIVVTEGGVTRWDTGRVESAENVGIAYDGPLHSRTRYDWIVTVWDASGTEAGSAGSWFETALLHPDEWEGAWIARDPNVHPPFDPPVVDDLTDRVRHLPAPPHLRRSFTLAEKPVRARLYATARGVYEARLNGTKVGDQELAPGWTEYGTRVLYQTYDVTDALTAGENVLGAVLVDGWYAGYIGFDSRHQAQHYGDAPQFLAQLVLEFADGSTRTIATGPDWVERPGAILYADQLMGQYEDASRAISGWDAPDYDASDWTPVIVADAHPAKLVAQPDEPVRVTEELTALSVTAMDDGRHLVDFGQNMVGRVRLTIRGAKSGRRIELRHAEVLADGELYLENLRTAEATDIYLAAGADTEVFEPAFTFHGFRYVEVRGYPGLLHAKDVVGRVLHSDSPFTGSFESSDPTVNQLFSNIRWGQRGNWVSVPTDCPQRDERLGWLADAQIFAPTATRNADVQAFFARWLADVRAAATPDGAFPDVAPKVSMLTEGAPAWGDGGVIIPWLLYRAYGDRRTLERSFDSMAAWIGHVHRHNPDLIWSKRTGNNYGDWLQIDAETPRALLATAYFAQSVAIVAAAARVLGKDAAPYEELHGRIRDAFNDAFVEDDGLVVGDTQTGYLLALAFDLLPEHLIESAARRLAADVEKRDNHLTTGFVGVALLCPTLAKHGRADLAYALLHQDTYPSWGYSIVHGATTIWERWDGWTADKGFQAAEMNSFNHYSLGSVGEWLYGGVAGIDQAPDSVGYRALVLRPTVGGRLTWAKASQETVRGRVASGWRIDGDQVVVDVEVPPGATAELHVPTSDPSSIRDSDGEAVTGPVHLKSGTYRFTASR